MSETSHMDACERSDICTFFKNNLREMPSLSKTLRLKYCEGEHSKCARHMIHTKLMQGYTPVDDDSMFAIDRAMQVLFPNDRDSAQSIISRMAR